MSTDDIFMHYALEQAILAMAEDEVPVGAVAVLNGEVIAGAHNRVIQAKDPAGHAEILCLQLAARSVQNYRLNEIELYVTLEPCAMCYGAMVHARIKRLVFGASDPKSGALGGAFDIRESAPFNHRIQIDGGVFAEDSVVLLQTFFKSRR